MATSINQSQLCTILAHFRSKLRSIHFGTYVHFQVYGASGRVAIAAPNASFGRLRTGNAQANIGDRVSTKQVRVRTRRVTVRCASTLSALQSMFRDYTCTVSSQEKMHIYIALASARLKTSRNMASTTRQKMISIS